MRYCALIFIFLSSVLFGATQQRLVVRGDSPLSAVLSSQDYSRISMGNGRKVHQVMAEKGFLSVTQESGSGTAIVKPTQTAPNQFSIFVKDDLGTLYTVTIGLKNVAAQHILIEPKQKRRQQARSQARHSELRQSTNALFKAMYTQRSSHGFDIQAMNEPVPLWKEARIRLVQMYHGGSKIGYVYELRNVSKKVLKFHESEFMNLAPYAIAVGLQSSTVAIGQSTRIFVVGRSKSGGAS